MLINRFTCAIAAAAALAVSVLSSPVAQADNVGYLVNVTMRPGYHFAGPDDALAYGLGLCDDIGAGHPYTAMIDKVKTDQQTGDEFQAEYLINQAAQELCPAQIWQLRQSAGGYQPRETS